MALAEKIQYMADGIGVRRIRAIPNKVALETTHMRLVGALNKRNIIPLGTVYFDPQINAAGLDGRPLPRSRAQGDMRIIIRALLGEINHGR